MTNDQIRAIVGTEPQPWWPAQVKVESGYFVCPVFNKGGDWEHAALAVDHAEAMFIGAAAAWLLSRDASVVRLPHDMYGVRIPALFAVGKKAQEGSQWCKSTNLLAALVAACKEGQ